MKMKKEENEILRKMSKFILGIFDITYSSRFLF